MEARAQQLAQALDTSEIGLVDGAGRFHFDADVLSAPLHDDVNLITVLIAQVIKPDAFRVSGGLLRYFTEDRSEERRVGKECRSRRWRYDDKKKEGRM